MTRVLRVSPGGSKAGERTLAVEQPVAVEVNGIGYAVMMATPADLAEFATGFLLTERLADSAADVLDHEAVEVDGGTILRVTLAPRCAGRIGDRVRHRTSDTGCGLCGIASLESLRRPAPRAPRPDIAAPAIFAALASLRDHQPLSRETGAVHAAALCSAPGTILAGYEDVGRHNALDKLVGRIARDALPVAAGFVLVTSRLSFEMVDKALISGASMLVGISAATTLALDHARAHGLTLVALARPDAMLVLHDPHSLFD
jgi:FdhD protein